MNAQPTHAACGGLGKTVLLQGMTGSCIHEVSSYPWFAAPYGWRPAIATLLVYQRANRGVHQHLPTGGQGDRMILCMKSLAGRIAGAGKSCNIVSTDRKCV